MRSLFAGILLYLLIHVNSFAQKPLTHDVYNSWKNISAAIISDDGRYISWEVNPQQGDGWLYVFDLKKEITDSVKRGYNAKFSASSQFLVYQVKPTYAATRKAKVDKKKKEDLPKDSLAIWLLEKDTILRYAAIRSYLLPSESSNDWLAIWYAYSEEKPDTVVHKSEHSKNKLPKKSKQIKETGNLQFINPLKNSERTEKLVLEVNASANGAKFAFSYLDSDTSEKVSVSIFDPENISGKNIFSSGTAVKKISLDKEGKQLAFFLSRDTSKTKTYSLFFWAKPLNLAYSLVDTATSGLQKAWAPSENSTIFFSKDGQRLFFGTSKRPVAEPKDTLLEDEKIALDIWNWKDDLLQPQQKVQMETERKSSYLAIYYPALKKFIQLADTNIRDLIMTWKGMGDYAIGLERKPFLKMASWDASNYKNIYTLNLNTGEKKLIASRSGAQVFLSPNGKNSVWYLPSDSSWHATNLATGISQNLTKQLGVNFFYEWNDVPALPGSYGFAGWLRDDNSVLINDHYDIWKFDLNGKTKPVNITSGTGRKNFTQYRLLNLDPDEEFVDFSKAQILSAFNENNKESGFYKLQTNLSSAPVQIVFGKYSYVNPLKARKASTYLWRRGSFREFNDLWYINNLSAIAKRISNANPQQSKYLWGDVRLVEWTSLNKEKLQGLLYTPENMKPGKKYPMLIYFYERNSDGLYYHFVPAPSRSILNRPYCTSNDYVLFIPDITYKTGYPGRSAMDAIVSGSLAMCDQFDFIDKNNMGLQGQSWGGYQVAYLITQTNLFKAAMAGAPVSNMTSAYGGIRWGTGMSRMFQYEQEQSRIGGSLWDKTLLYLENSPIFNLPKVNTPLLIMHNDMDGSVPWYQGIELFTALRRLDKPVWMLTYNGEDHNLTRRPNMMDLSVRMMQFFDYYLKGMPQPVWMSEGIPALNKGKVAGYEFER